MDCYSSPHPDHHHHHARTARRFHDPSCPPLTSSSAEEQPSLSRGPSLNDPLNSPGGNSGNDIYNSPVAVQRRRFSATQQQPTLGAGATRNSEVVQRDALVDLVHHDSPSGPAVSIYPRQGSRRNLNAAPPRKPPPPLQQEEWQRRGSLQRAEALKLAQYGGGGMGGGSSHSLKKPPPTAPMPPKRSVSCSAATAATMIEISPGVRVRLRGSAETMEYVRQDLTIPAVCFACDLNLFCIQDCQFVLCPRCKVVNPTTATDMMHGGGVGLGMSIDMLYNIQQEIIMSSTPSHNRGSGGGGRYSESRRWW